MSQKFKTSFQKDTFLWSVLLLFGIYFSLISLVNHYFFRTFTLDLGLYTNALYDYAHFSFNDSTTIKEQAENLLADHFDLYLPIFSPFIYIFGTYTLLIIQIVFLLIGATGVYRFIEYKYPNTSLKYFALIYFLSFYGLYSAVSFDYHSNVVASMLIPWLFLSIEKKNLLLAGTLAFFILIGKENLSLWLVFIGTGLFVKYFRDVQLRYFTIGIAIISLIYFVCITGFVMPALSNTGKYPHFHYSQLGTTTCEAFKYIITHPFESIHMLFTNHSGSEKYDFVKIELWIFLVVSGFFCIFRPLYLWMLLPILGQKLFHDNPSMWGVIHHYSIEFAPIFAIGTFTAIAAIRHKRLQKASACLAVFLALVCTFRFMDRTIINTGKANVRLYQMQHYQRVIPIHEAKIVFDIIPDKAIVSTQTAFVPQLALRPSIYQFPIIKDAEYILLSPDDDCFPMTKKELDTEINRLIQSPDWKILFRNKHFLLFCRGIGFMQIHKN